MTKAFWSITTALIAVSALSASVAAPLGGEDMLQRYFDEQNTFLKPSGNSPGISFDAGISLASPFSGSTFGSRLSEGGGEVLGGGFDNGGPQVGESGGTAVEGGFTVSAPTPSSIANTDNLTLPMDLDSALASAQMRHGIHVLGQPALLAVGEVLAEELAMRLLRAEFQRARRGSHGLFVMIAIQKGLDDLCWLRAKVVDTECTWNKMSDTEEAVQPEPTPRSPDVVQH